MKTYEHVYDILSKSPDFVTGESLAKSLGVSRTAIWKAIQTLQEQGIIPTKWKSEFELYMLVKSYFEDTIYQYHNEWLGLQSLDIFIPQINLGIEYQGIQHYQAVELFGGEEGYITRQKRDKIKKEKCKQENVKLLYWDYRVQISDTNLEELLNSIGINLPPKKVNVSYTPYEKQ